MQQRHNSLHNGASLVWCCVEQAKGHALADQLTRQYPACKSIFITADLAEVNACKHVIDAAEHHFDRLDILVNVAALTAQGNLLNTSPELFDRMMAINLRAPFFLMQHAAKMMKAHKIKGSIINIGSISAMAGQSFITAYCASKGGLNTLTHNAAHALLPDQIRVNCLNIGWMDSDGEDDIQRKYHGANDGWQQQAGRQLPFGRLINPAEVARAIAFLASVESGLMTGSVINFDQTVWGACDGNPAPTQPLQD